MPRAKTTEVIEHRITLGDFERKEFKEYLDVRDTAQKIDNVIDASKGVLFAGSAFAIGYIGYLALVEIFELVDNVTPKVKSAIYGKPTYPTEQVPNNPDDWVNRDPETGERINPMHPVPIAGGLVGIGMQIGEAIPVGSYLRSGIDGIASIFD